MKYFAGINFPSLVCAELGKKEPPGPSPSAFISPGAISGLSIGVDAVHRLTREYRAAPPIRIATTNRSAHWTASLLGWLANHPLRRNQLANTRSAPANDRVACSHK